MRIYMIIYTVPCGSLSGSLSCTCSQLSFDKVYRDKMVFDLWGTCVLCVEESVRKTSRRAIRENWAYNSLSPWRAAGCAVQICREQICHERSLGIYPLGDRGGDERGCGWETGENGTEREEQWKGCADKGVMRMCCACAKIQRAASDNLLAH